jgi:hypothetical protein
VTKSRLSVQCGSVFEISHLLIYIYLLRSAIRQCLATCTGCTRSERRSGNGSKNSSLALNCSRRPIGRPTERGELA